MDERLILRPANILDADALLQWRNDHNTRKASHNTMEISRDEHIAWLTDTLINKNRKLFIAELGGTAVGTVRADCLQNEWELSWTIASHVRGKGIAKHMVALLSKQLFEPIRAEIKAGNVASMKIAEFAGMTFIKESAGILHYRREALTE